MLEKIPTADCIRIALINNMPDPALEDTEAQFLGVLESAAQKLPVHAQLYSLPEVARSERVRQRMGRRYGDFSTLWNSRIDALIITGTEPRENDLRKEGYWKTLTDVFDWAERETVSTVLSCLAAHASVLHSDGVERRRLTEKRFGVFDERRVTAHALTATAPGTLRIPHSRWNELREEDLVSCGCTILTKSVAAGVGIFAKERGKSLFVYSQGHPEYGTATLLKEYRRDVKRFIRGERETYPEMPQGYLDAHAVALLEDFRAQAMRNRREDVLTAFPDSGISPNLQNGWHAAGASIYRNWLEYVAMRKFETKRHSVMSIAEPSEHKNRRARAATR